MPLPLLLLILVGIACLALAWKTQNRLAPLRERVDEAASNIKTCTDKRNRLIKQLVDIAAAYATHEREVHEHISADFNTPAQIALDPKGAIAYVTHLTNTFPQLRADGTYLNLTRDLNVLEGELQAKFETHNATVREYNSVRLSFPTAFFCWGGGFEVAEYLDSTEPAQAQPEGKPEKQRT